MDSVVVHVIAPGNAKTGGVELLHQLVNCLTENGHKAFINYYPFDKSFEIPEAYHKYKCNKSNLTDINIDNHFVILPEVYTHLINKFNKGRVYLWWMSVDNYFGSKSLKYCIGNGFLPFSYIKERNIRKGVCAGYLYQSEYAKKFLLDNCAKNIFSLSDYINNDYFLHANNFDKKVKQNIVVYNPAKGKERTAKLISISDDILFVPIENMNRDEVAELLLKAKVYIDLGEHPGKDRIPREAAILGCCVITNKRGSASNDVDIPIPGMYKFNDHVNGIEFEIRELIRKIFQDYESLLKDFNLYREVIASEKSVFESDVKYFSEMLNRTIALK